MWQITWMLSLLPDWFWTLVLITGIIGALAAWVLTFVPFVSKYRLPMTVGSVLLLVTGVYFQGVIANEAKWQAKMDELEAQVVKAEAAAKEKNVEVQKEIVYKDRVVKEKGQTQIQYIDREIVKKEEIVKYIENCPVPKDIIDEHNKAAAKGEKK